MTEPATDPIEIRRRYLEERLAFNQRNLASLDRDKRRIPWLLLLVFLAIPAGIYYGPFAAILVFAGALFTVASGFYLVWGHKSEYQQKVVEIQQELRRIGGGS